MNTHSPFAQPTSLPFVVIPGKRAGYIQLATSQETDQHAEVATQLFVAAQTWCAFLQTQDVIEKIYWLQFSEVVSHLHWHLYPRFKTDTLKGTLAFDARNDVTQHEPWPLHWQAGLIQWCERYGILINDVDSVLNQAN